MDGLDLALLFWPAAALMLVTGYFVFRTDSMARAGLLLLASLGIEGLVFLMLSSEFLGVLQLLMMAGEMVIMVFFMIMFMHDPGGLMGMDMTHQKRTAGGLAALAGVGLALTAVLVDWHAGRGPTATVRQIGFEVMGRGFFVFLLAAITIMLAMVGAIMLASHRGRYEIDAPAAERTAREVAREALAAPGEEQSDRERTS